MEENLPIDIQTSKLLDWLVSRRHVPHDWADPVRIVREKINNAIQDMPEHPEITKLLSGTYINYYHCLRIVEILAETEKDSKNIFGWYTSQRMKDWKEIVNLYEKNNIYLAEAAQMLVRSVNFDVPAIKRQINKCIQIQEECEKKEGDCIKNAISADNRYKESCDTLGIPGEKVKAELVDLLKELPNEFDKIHKMSENLDEARSYYLDFITFTIPQSQVQCLPLLKFFIDKGNARVYEWTYGEPPISVEEPHLQYHIEEESTEDNDEIDFGDEGIDFGDVDVNVEVAEGDIDWGDLGADGDTIDWGGAQADTVDIGGITIEDSGVSGGVAKDHEALTLLMYHKTRDQFINELIELEGFLQQRKRDFEGEGSILSMNQFANAPPSVQYQTSSTVSALLFSVSRALSLLTTTKMLHLFMISTSEKYVDRLAAALKTKKCVSGKILASKDKAIEKRKSALQEQQELAPKLQLIISRTKELQKSIEGSISEKYKKRPVNLMGGIHML